MSLRGHGVNFPGQLYAAVEVTESRPCPYKDVELMGFLGRLLTNVDLPDGFALGRAVSHGYGWVLRIDPLQEERR
jgi:Cas6b C-terminal domain